MALPKLTPTSYNFTLPMSKRSVSIRGYTLDDEKVLLMASKSRSTDPKFYLDNTLRVVQNCIISGDSIEDLPSVDVEYLLLQLRGISVGETAKLSYVEEEGDKPVTIEINLNKFYVTPRDKSEYVIKITEEVGLMLKELTFREKLESAQAGESDAIFDMVIASVKAVYDKDTVYEIGVQTTKEEIREFINSTTGVSKDLYKFIASMPQLKVDVSVNNKTKTLTGAEINFLA